MIRRHYVGPGREAAVRVGSRSTQVGALQEACRRAAVMAAKWPEKRWRFRVQSERHCRGCGRKQWAIYAILPPESC
jgi:hypothetical protein